MAEYVVELTEKQTTDLRRFSMQDDDDLSIRPSIVEPDGFCAWGVPREGGADD